MVTFLLGVGYPTLHSLCSQIQRCFAPTLIPGTGKKWKKHLKYKESIPNDTTQARNMTKVYDSTLK